MINYGNPSPWEAVTTIDQNMRMGFDNLSKQLNDVLQGGEDDASENMQNASENRVEN